MTQLNRPFGRIAGEGANFTPHDLRRTVSTGMAELGVDDKVIEKVLNHSDGSVAGIYNRHTYDNEKRGADAVGEAGTGDREGRGFRQGCATARISALSLIRDADGRLQIRPSARAAGDVLGDLFSERSGVGAVVEPAFLLHGDTGRGVGESDAHAPDSPAGLAQEPDHGFVARPHLCVANDYYRAGHSAG